MKKLLLIDMKFTNEGHFIDDLLSLEFLIDNFEITYIVPVGLLNKNTINRINKINIKIIEYKNNMQLLFLLRLNKKSKVLFLSAGYIELFAISLFSGFNYYLRIHFFPNTKQLLYKFLFRLFSQYVNRLIVLDEVVKNDLIKRVGIKEDKITVIHSRFSEENKVDIDKKNVILSIGSHNKFKDYSILLKVLKKHKFTNLKFIFASKNITKFYDFSEVSVVNNIEVFDEFIDDERYHALIKSSKYLFIPYAESYGIRFSGLLFDALANNTKVITTVLPQFTYYINNYNAGYYYEDIKGLTNILVDIEKSQDNKKIDKSFYSDFSIEELKIKYNNLMKDR